MNFENFENFENEFELLLKTFEALNYKKHDFITKKQFYKILDTKKGNEFDRNLAQQIFDHCQSNAETKLVEELIEKIINCKQNVLRKIDNFYRCLQEYKANLRNAILNLGKNFYLQRYKLDKYRNNEPYNAYGIIKDSCLQVNIYEGKIVHRVINKTKIDNIDDKFYCVANLLDTNYSQKTEFANIENLKWNCKFNFPIETGLETLVISMRLPDDDNISFTNYIPIQSLRDQCLKEFWIKLEEAHEDLDYFFRVRVSVQWIHSNVKYYHDVIKKWEEIISIDENDLKEYQQYIIEIFLTFPEIKEIVKEKTETKFTDQEIILKKNIYKKIEFYPKLLTTIYLIFVIMIFSFKSDFIDIIIGCFFLICLRNQSLDVIKFKWVLMLIALSIFSDSIWLIIFTEIFWNDTMIFSTHYDKIIYRCAVILSYFILFIKVPLVLSYIQYFSNINEIKQNEENNDYYPEYNEFSNDYAFFAKENNIQMNLDKEDNSTYSIPENKIIETKNNYIMTKDIEDE